MPFFDFNGKNVYYEDMGEGKPVVLLNGIMMSTPSWEMFREPFSSANRLILLDFLDQGKSDKMDTPYTQEIQAEVLRALLDELGLEKVSLVGISYGGEVALAFSVKHQERIDRMVLFNTSYRTSPWLRDIGDAWNLTSENALGYYLTTIPVIYSPKFYNERKDFMDARRNLLVANVFSNKTFMDAMVRLTRSAEDFNLEESLKGVGTRTLIVSSDTDFLTPRAEQERLRQLLRNSDHLVIPDAGHASMYEKPLLFSALALGFINVSKTIYEVK